MKRLLAGAAVLLLAGAVALFWWNSNTDRSARADLADSTLPVEAVKVVVPAAPPPSGNGQISGRVFGSSGEPLAGVEVDVKLVAAAAVPADCAALLEGCSCGDRLESALARLDEAFASLGETKTGADGRFTVTGLPSLPMRVRATDLSRYATAEVHVGDKELSLTLSQPMAEGVVVLDEQERPLKGAAVVAVAEGRIFDFDRTQESGVIFLLAPPWAKLRVFAPGLAPGEPDLSTSVELGSEDGGALQAYGRLVQLERGTIIRGRLETLDGGALGGAEIKAAPGSFEGSTVCATAVSEPDGTYLLGPLPGERFKLEAQAGKRHLTFNYPPDGQRGATDGAVVTQLLEDATVRGKVIDEQGLAIPEAAATLLRFPFGGGSGDRSELVLDGRGRFEHTVVAGNVTLEAKAAGYLTSGAEKRVEENETWETTMVMKRAAGLRGRVEGANGQPVKGAQIYARLVNPEPLGKAPSPPRFPPSTTTDSLGNFTLETYPGDVEVQVSANAFLSAKLQTHAPQDGLKIVLARGATVKGRVLNEDHTPAPRISISVEGANNQGSFGAQTGADGTFTAEGIPAGAFNVRATEYAKPSSDPAPGTMMRMTRLTRSAQKAIDVTDTSGPFVELIFEGVKVARGRVVDERGTPLAGVTVKLEGLGASYSSAAPNLDMQVRPQVSRMPGLLGGYGPQAVSDETGAFTFEGLDRPYRALAEWQELREDPSVPVEIRPGSDAVLTLIHRHFLTADFTSSDGQPVSSVFVGFTTAQTPGGHLSFEIRVQGSGPLSFGAVGHLTVRRNVALSPRADLALGPIRLETGRTLTAHVSDAVSGASLNSLAWWSSGGVTVMREDRGDAVALAVPAGDLTLDVGAMDHVLQTVKVAASQSSIAVQLDPGSVVTGHVTKADGRPVVGYYYVIVTCGPAEAGAFAALGGLATVKGVPAGNCTAVAAAPNGGPRGPSKPVAVPMHGSVAVDLVAPPL